MRHVWFFQDNVVFSWSAEWESSVAVNFSLTENLHGLEYFVWFYRTCTVAVSVQLLCCCSLPDRSSCEQQPTHLVFCDTFQMWNWFSTWDFGIRTFFLAVRTNRDAAREFFRVLTPLDGWGGQEGYGGRRWRCSRGMGSSAIRFLFISRSLTFTITLGKLAMDFTDRCSRVSVLTTTLH